jgi:hypothetical protein
MVVLMMIVPIGLDKLLLRYKNKVIQVQILMMPKSKLLVIQWIFEIGASFKFEFATSEKNEYKMQSYTM